jgi:hypothetical protein
LGFLLCIRMACIPVFPLGIALSIPFIGIFVMHPHPDHLGLLAGAINFQFPLLGFLLCIPNEEN